MAIGEAVKRHEELPSFTGSMFRRVQAPPVAIALDGDDCGMMKQAILDRRGNDEVSKDTSPFADRSI